MFLQICFKYVVIFVQVYWGGRFLFYIQQEAQGPGAQLTVEQTLRGKKPDFEISLPIRVARQYIFAIVAS
jgi:hypothetical protein